MLQHLSSAVVGGKGRPSVETALHAMLGRVVIHTHPVAANALNCGPGVKALKEITTSRVSSLRSGFLTPTRAGGWRTPFKSMAEAYRQKHGALPAVLFMENHGLLVSAPERDSLRCASRRLGEPLRAIFQVGLVPGALPSPWIQPLCAKPWFPSVRRWRDVKGGAPFARLTDNTELASVACDETSRPVCRWFADP